MQADGPIDQTLAGYRRAIEQRAEANADVKGLVRVTDVSAEGTDGRLVTVAEDCTIRLSLETDQDRSTMLYLGVSEGAATPIFVVRHAADPAGGAHRHPDRARPPAAAAPPVLPVVRRVREGHQGRADRVAADRAVHRVRPAPAQPGPPGDRPPLARVRGRPLVQGELSPAVREPRLVLLVGAPRSGTTWLQSMLGAHPAAATPQETDLFSRYVTPLADAWSWQLRGGPDAWRKRRFKGLPAVS